jgi:serine/threonine-protein kinase
VRTGPDSLHPKSRIDRYELLCHVAEGGMGTVWAARQLGKHGFEKIVAFKTVKPERMEDVSFDFRRMFLDEVRVASRIEHPNVAQVLDVGEDKDLLFMVMELVDGDSLAALVSAVHGAGQPFPFGIALRIAADVCSGLHAAHELRDRDGRPLGVVHRDVSPQNVLLTRTGVVKVIDFGVAKSQGRLSDATSAGSLKGKLRYMAPEQARGQELDRRADVYSVGAILYRLATGQAPFEGPNEAATLTSLLSAQRPAPLPDDVPQGMRAVIERALSPSPEDRFATADEMRAEIEAAMAAHRITATAADVAAFLVRYLGHRLDARREAIELAIRVADAKPAEAPALVLRQPTVPDLESPAAARTEVAPSGAGLNAPSLPQAPALAPPSAPRAAPQQSPPPAAPMEDVLEGSGPGFMNVEALLRKAQGAPELEAPKKAPAAAPAPAKPTQEVKIELAVPRRPRVEAPRAQPPKWKRIAVATGALVAAVVVVLLVLPIYAKHALVSAARDRGLAMTIDHVGVSLGSIEASGVAISSAEVPSVKVACKELRVVSTLSPQTVHLRGVDVRVTGSLADVSAQLDAWRARPTHGAGGSVRSISVTGARVVWSKVFGEGYELELEDLGVELGGASALGDDLKLDARKVELRSPRGRLGPWGLAVERDRKSTRTRLELDPVVPDGPHALLVTAASLAPRLTVKVTRSPLLRLGIPPEALGLKGPPEVELDVEGTVDGGKLDASFSVALYGAKLGDAPNAIDMKLKGVLFGDARKPLDLQKGELVVGPFVAQTTGTITPLEPGGFRVDLSWKAAPIACEVLAKRAAQGPAQLGLELAQTLGIAKVVGTAKASGLLSFDTTAPQKAALTMITNDTCGLAIFPDK